MKKLFLLSLLILPQFAIAKFGWSFAHISLLAGKQYSSYGSPFPHFDLQYDVFRKSCTSSSHYKGLGIHYRENEKLQAYGLQFMYNPTRWYLALQRSVHFYPFLFIQGNQYHSKSSASYAGNRQSFSSCRPGIGIIGNIMENKIIAIKTAVQLGYELPFKNNADINPSFTCEWKIGIALHIGKFFHTIETSGSDEAEKTTP